MKRILLFLAVLCLTAGPVSAQPVELQYDPATGNLAIDTFSSLVRLRSFELLGGSTPFTPANRNRIFPVEIVAASNPSHIRVFSDAPLTPNEALLIDPTLNSVIQGTRWDLGDLLPAGLTEQQFIDAVPLASWHPISPGPSRPFIPVYVPEPGSLVLLGVAGMMASRRRRGPAAC